MKISNFMQITKSKWEQATSSEGKLVYWHDEIITILVAAVIIQAPIIA